MCHLGPSRFRRLSYDQLGPPARGVAKGTALRKLAKKKARLCGRSPREKTTPTPDFVGGTRATIATKNDTAFRTRPRKSPAGARRSGVKSRSCNAAFPWGRNAVMTLRILACDEKSNFASDTIAARKQICRAARFSNRSASDSRPVDRSSVPVCSSSTLRGEYLGCDSDLQFQLWLSRRFSRERTVQPSSYTLNRFQKIDRLLNRQLWISRAGKGS
jgi:hypothetical protein